MILLAAFVATLVVVIHGYWSEANYQPPPFLVGVITAAVTTALHILGVVVGGSQATQTMNQTAQAIKTASEPTTPGH